MQTLTRPKLSLPNEIIPGTTRRRKRISPQMFIGMIMTLVIAAGAGVFLVARPYFVSHAQEVEEVNANCTLIVPPNPLTAQGLATPYQLTATDRDMGPCREANADQAAFVEGAVLDPATGQISIYSPLVVDRGREPAIDPVVPILPQGAVVALWFGFNGDNLTLKGQGNSLQDSKCVNGLAGSIFGQFAYCNAPDFFTAANQAIQAGKLKPPALGTAKDGQTCPTVRDFSIVDQDQSDNVTTKYLIDNRGRTAQLNAANTAQLQNAAVQVNGSDNLLAVAVDGALGCTPWMAPNLADPGQNVPALPLNELQAAAHQAAPIALVPIGDPMVQVNGNNNLDKLNLYRQGVDQPAVQNAAQANTTMYCKSLLAVGPPRIMLDAPFTKQSPSPDPAAANNLFTFLAQRFNATWGADGGINCQGLLDMNSPIQVTTDDNGVAIDATLGGAKQKNKKGQKDQEDQGQKDQKDQEDQGQKDQEDQEDQEDQGQKGQKDQDQEGQQGQKDQQRPQSQQSQQGLQWPQNQQSQGQQWTQLSLGQLGQKR